jgi:hypothetical protein
MSGNQGNSRKGGNPRTTNKADAPVFRAKAKPKVSPIAGGNFDYSGDPRLKESFVVVLSSSDRTKSITFHHPIGKTDLGSDMWVATPTGEVPDLVARRDDPDEATIREKRETHRFEAAITAGYISRDEDGEVLYPSGEDRQDALTAARAAAKAAAKKAGNKPAPMAYLAHLSAERRAEEDALRQYLQSKAVVRAAEKDFPDSTYRTKSGPLADRVQKAQAYLTGKTRAQAEDAVIQRLFD